MRGDFGYLADGVGHEKYNFLPAADGRYYAYTPPLGQQRSAPMPADPDDWLVFAVSKRPRTSGLFLVGWYEHATFVRGYAVRPDASDLGRDSDGGHFSYTLSSPQAHAVPLPLRDRKVRGDHLKRSYAYLRGNDLVDPWRKALARRLLSFRSESHDRLKVGHLTEEAPRLAFCGSAARRKAIEEAAVKAVRSFYANWTCISRKAAKCGFDLLMTQEGTGDIHHVEVKGTSLDEPHFFITEKELSYARKLSANNRKGRLNSAGEVRPVWRLAMVHDVDRTRKVSIYSYAEMVSAFDLSPYAHHGTLKIR